MKQYVDTGMRLEDFKEGDLVKFPREYAPSSAAKVTVGKRYKVIRVDKEYVRIIQDNDKPNGFLPRVLLLAEPEVDLKELYLRKVAAERAFAEASEARTEAVNAWRTALDMVEAEAYP